MHLSDSLDGEEAEAIWVVRKQGFYLLCWFDWEDLCHATDGRDC